jgi:hypothetical protein
MIPRRLISTGGGEGSRRARVVVVLFPSLSGVKTLTGGRATGQDGPSRLCQSIQPQLDNGSTAFPARLAGSTPEQ